MHLIAAIPSPPLNVIEIGPLTVHFYGILIALGVITALIVSRGRYVRFDGAAELFEKVAIWAVVFGFLGARLGYVTTHTHRFTDRPWAVFFIWEGGLALYGGLLVGAITVIFLMNRHNGDIFAFGDSVAIGVPLAQAIGRFGNYFNQELFGTPSDLPWAIIIDPARRPAGYEQFETFHPTFLYEAVWNAFIIVPVILILEKRGKLFKSTSFGIYIAMYAFIRFMMELLRTDTTFRFLGISRNGWVSIAAFLFGVGWIIYAQRRKEKRTLVGKPTFFSLQPATESTLDEADDEAASAEDEASAVDESDLREAVDEHRPSWARKPKSGEDEPDG
ncbi:MAG: prolipoprotein diacylglyceryl transferase [Acidimicrobiia bacterium]